jgi:heat shock protein HslJ
MSSTRILLHGMTLHRGRYALIVGLLMLVAVGCGSDDSDDSSSGTSTRPASPNLAGTHWILGPDTVLGVPATGITLTAAFDDRRLTGNSGCNSYNASYETNGDKLTIGPVAGTKMACGPAPTAVEQAYLARLELVASYGIDGGALTLFGPARAALLVYEPSTGSEAIIGNWTAINYFSGSAVQSVANGSKPTAGFTAEEVSGDGGCNTFTGPVDVTATTIVMGPFASTLRACADPALQDQEAAYLAALELARTYRVTGDRLELLRAGGGIAATFERS